MITDKELMYAMMGLFLAVFFLLLMMLDEVLP